VKKLELKEKIMDCSGGKSMNIDPKDNKLYEGKKTACSEHLMRIL